MRVECTLSANGVSLNLTVGESKATTVVDWKSRITQNIQTSTADAWLEDHRTNMHCRMAMLALYSQCLEAVAQAREQGTTIELEESSPTLSDSFAVKFGKRSIRIQRSNHKVIKALFYGFPVVWPPLKATADRDLSIPIEPGLLDAWALEVTMEAIDALTLGA